MPRAAPHRNGPRIAACPADARLVSRTLEKRLRAEHGDCPETVVLAELGLLCGHVRADLTLVNSRLYGFEIKTDRDSVRRLERQAAAYGNIFDCVTLVAGPRRIRDAAGMVPPWWGIISFSGGARRIEFRPVRAARPNPNRNPRALAQLIWRGRALELLELRGAVRGVRGKTRAAIWDRLCEVYGLEEIAAEVRTGLKARAARRAIPRQR